MYLQSYNMFEEGDKTVIVNQSKPASLVSWGDVTSKLAVGIWLPSELESKKKKNRKTTALWWE